MSSTLSPEQIKQAAEAIVFDEEGVEHHLGELNSGKRTAVIFVRHWWCGNCQAYVRQLGQIIPPTSLPGDTFIIIIGCGDYQPIKAYNETTQSQYKIYANPSLSLYKLLSFNSNFEASKAGQEKEYEKDLGGSLTRVWNSIKQGPVKHIGHVSKVGPKSLHGGEIVFDPDGSVSFFHRMEHTADHLELKDLAKILETEPVDIHRSAEDSLSCDNGVQV